MSFFSTLTEGLFERVPFFQETFLEIGSDKCPLLQSVGDRQINCDVDAVGICYVEVEVKIRKSSKNLMFWPFECRLQVTGFFSESLVVFHVQKVVHGEAGESVFF